MSVKPKVEEIDLAAAGGRVAELLSEIADPSIATMNVHSQHVLASVTAAGVHAVA